MSPLLTWFLFAIVIVALLIWVRGLRRQLRLANYRVARLQRDMAGLREQVQALQTAQEALMEAFPEAVLVADEHRRVIALSPIAQTLFETEPGHSVIETTHSHELHQMVNDVLASGAGLARQITLRDRVYRTCVVPIPTGGGVVIALQDVTELGQLARARQAFIINLAQELRHPLTSIKRLVETLQSDIEDQAQRRELLAQVAGHVNALSELAQEMFDLAELESGRAPFSTTEITARQVVEDVVNRLQSQAEGKHLELHIDVPDDLCALADRTKVIRALTHLVHNAIKFTPEQGQVWIQARELDADEVPRADILSPTHRDEPLLPEDHPPGRWVLISVADTGPGIPPYDLPRIFERFYKVSRAEIGEEGAGLGLAIARHIVEGHGGRLWARNAEEGGSVFAFTLPACP
jgi:two-component system phosphate regulon sensor histidine kinase PhoR